MYFYTISSAGNKKLLFYLFYYIKQMSSMI